MSASEASVVLDIVDRIATMRLNRPPLNPIDSELRDALIAAVRQIEDDPEVNALIIHGGERHFAAGADIEALASMSYVEIIDWNTRLQQAFTAIAGLRIPVIAAINGYALGGGLELALTADIRIGSTECVVGLPEITLGIIPGSGGTQRLTQIVGRSTAKRLIFTGRKVEATEADQLGIVDWTVSPERTIAEATELAVELAAAPRWALRAIKESVDAALPIDPKGLALERSLLAGTFAAPDRVESMERFLSRRSARRAPREKP